MTYTERIKHGFAIANKYWQLVVIQVGAVIINLIALMVFVGLPIIVLGVALGVEAERSGDITRFLDPTSYASALSEYLGALLVLALCVFVYVTFAMVLWLLVSGGTVGSLAHASRSPEAAFSMRVFWAEAKKLFAPLAWYYTILSVALLAVFAAIAAAFVAGAFAYMAAGLEDSRLGIFVTVMGVLSLGSCGLFFSMCLYILSVQGLAPLAVDGKSAMGSIKDAWATLKGDRTSLYLMLIVVGGYVLVQIAMAMVAGVLQLIPLLGMIIYLPYSIAANILGIYLYMALLGTVISHYADATKPSAETSETLETTVSSPSASGSSDQEGTSAPEASWQVPPPFYPYGR